MSVGISSFMLGQDEEYSKEKTKESSRITSDYQDLSALDLETKLYYIMHDVLRERMTVPPGNDTKELDMIDEMVRNRMSELISEEYPRTEGIFNIQILEWDVQVLLDEMNTSALLKEASTTECGRTYVMDNSTLAELETAAPPFVQATSKAVYFRLVGHVKYRIHNMDEDITIEKYSTFNKNVYSPLPLMKNLAARFQSDSSGEFSSMGRMIRYMITTLAQYRVLCGYAGGGYGGPNDGKQITDVITKEDVEIAVNLALLLTQAGYYRNFDREAAREQTASNDPDRDIEKLMDNYVNNGSIDPADLIALYNDLENLSVDPGRIFAQSVYSFADRFVWELLELFWGEEWDPEGDGTWDNEVYFDPTLDEPIVDWEEIEGKSDIEDWCRDRLWRWLGIFGEWLGLTMDEKSAGIPIQSRTNYNIYIEPIHDHITKYKITGEGVGAKTWDIDGNYYLFGHETDPATGFHLGEYWSIETYIKDVGETVDARYLILGEQGSAGEQDFDGRPYTFKIKCDDVGEWCPTIGEKTYEYYVVKKTLIEKHREYLGIGGPYYNTFRFIVDVLTRSMKQQPSDIDEINSKGMLDYAAYDTKTHFGERDCEMTINPKDTVTILSDESRKIITEDGCAINDAIIEFINYASGQKETWFQQGAYINDINHPDADDSSEYFLYDLIKETTDLWYEMIVNLYDGGQRNFDDNVNPPTGADWPNYNDWPNSELPLEEQTSKHETVDSSQLAGSFKFKNDALRDAYHRVMEVVKTRDQHFEFAITHWDDLNTDPAISPADPLSVVTEIVMIEGVPIPVPIHNNDGAANDYEIVWGLNPLDSLPVTARNKWTDKNIWLHVRDGFVSGIPESADDTGIKDEVEAILGHTEPPDGGLLNDITQEMNENLDSTTDEGTYGSSGNSYDFNGDFYDFAKVNIGKEFLSENALWDQVSKENGWLAQIIKTETLDRLDDNLDVFNIPFTSASRMNVPWEFWHGDRETALRNGSLFTEELVVDQVPNRLTEGGDHLNIEIKVPINGTHFVDVQDLEFPMSKDCFSSVWLVNITADAQYKIRNSRLSSVGTSDHDYFWYNHSVVLDIDFPVPIYSGWDLESGWQTEDIDYRMTRRYFQKMKDDVPADPFFASKALVETVDATRDAADWMLDSKTEAYHFIVNSPMMGSKEKSFFLSGLTTVMTRSADPRGDEEGLLESAASNNDYINNISQSATKLNELGLSEIKINYFGYDAVYHTATSVLEISRGDLDGGVNDTALNYMLKFDGDVNFKGEERIQDRVLLNYMMAGSPADFSITGELSPYNMRESGLVHNFSLDTGANLPVRYSAAAAVDNLFLPLLGKNATVRIGIISSAPLPDELSNAIGNTERFGLKEHRGAALTGQCEKYIKYFLGVLYNKYIDTLKVEKFIGISFNVTKTPGINAGYINKTYGIDLSGLSTTEGEMVLRLFIKHLINNSYYCLKSLMEPSGSPSFFLKMPREVMPYLVHSIYHREDGGDIWWQGSMAHTMTTTPYMGSPWDAGERTFTGGKLYPGGERYLLRYKMDAGI